MTRSPSMGAPMFHSFWRVLRRGRRLVGKLRRCTWAEWKELGVAGGTVGLVTVLLRTCSFQRARTLLRIDEPRSSTGQGLSVEDERRVLWAVAAISRRFFPDRPCLTQALAAQALLQWRGGCPGQLQIGVARGGDGALEAHAWLERDGHVILGGGESPHRYHPLSPRAVDGTHPR